MSAPTVRWMVPALGFVLFTGALGVTGKLALRSLVWQDVLLWVGLGYMTVACVLVLSGAGRLNTGVAGRWAAVSAALAITSVVSLYVALETGEASKVVPVSAAYPAVTLVLSAALLRERLSPARVGGMLLVVAGVVILTTA